MSRTCAAPATTSVRSASARRPTHHEAPPLVRAALSFCAQIKFPLRASNPEPAIPDTIHIGGPIHLPLAELEIDYIRSPGPGGQNVNKVASAAQLSFDLMGSPSLPEPVKLRAAAAAGSRLTTDGRIVITANRFRAQPQNRDDAIERLAALLRAALTPPKPRRPTRPTLASKRRRLDGKSKRSNIKSLRGRVDD